MKKYLRIATYTLVLMLSGWMLIRAILISLFYIRQAFRWGESALRP
jgi:hypothetical protein